MCNKRATISITVVFLHFVVADLEMFLYIWTSKQTNLQERTLTVILPIFSLSMDCTTVLVTSVYMYLLSQYMSKNLNNRSWVIRDVLTPLKEISSVFVIDHHPLFEPSKQRKCWYMKQLTMQFNIIEIRAS